MSQIAKENSVHLVDRHAQIIVDQDVFMNISTLVCDLTNVGDTEYSLWERRVNSDTYIECATDCQHAPKFIGGYWTTRQNDGLWVTFETEAEAAKDACEHFDLDPYEYAMEPHEHYAVSRKLAKALEDRGENIVHDWHGMDVWCRTTSGQRVSMDFVIGSIAAEWFKLKF